MDARATATFLAAWIFINVIQNVENRLDENSCNESYYNTYLSAIPNDSGSNSSTCKNAILAMAQLSPDDLGNNYLQNKAHFSTVCSEGCLPHAGRIVAFCLTKIKPILSWGCATNNATQCYHIPAAENGMAARNTCYDGVNSSQTNCPSSCQTELSRVKTATKCCFTNVFNTTLFGSKFTSLGLNNNTLLSACNLQLPEQCPIPTAISAASRISQVTGASEVQTTVSGHRMHYPTLFWPLLLILSFLFI